MNQLLPRTYKEFDSRWAKASRLKKFVIVSIFFHIIFAFVWVVPKKLAEMKKRELQERREKIEQEEKLALDEELEKAMKKITEEEKEELAEDQLKELYEELTKDILSKEEMKERWDELMEDLSPELESLSDVLSSDDFDVLEAEEKVAELKEEMIDKLYDNVMKETQESWKARYLKMLEAQLDNLAALFRQELDTRIGSPLTDQTLTMMQREIKAVQQQLNAAAAEMRTVQKEAQSLKKGMNESNRRIKKEMTSIEKEGKSREKLEKQARTVDSSKPQGKTRLAQLNSAIKASTDREEKSLSAIKREESSLKAGSGKLEKMHKPLENAKKRMEEFEEKVAEKISSIMKNDVPKAENEIKSEQENLKKNQTAAAVEEGEKTTQTADKIAKEASSTAAAISKLSAREVVHDRFRKLLAKMDKEELRKKFKKSFGKEFKEKGVPLLSKLIDEQFQKDIRKHGIIPPPLSIEKELAGMLGVELPEKVKAGESTTKKLREKHGLDKTTEKSERGDLEERTGKQVRKAADTLDGKEMKNVVSSAIGKGMALLGKGDASPDEGEAQNIALLDRLGNLKNQLAQGRKGFLGAGDRASLMQGHRRYVGRMGKIDRIRQFHTGFDRQAFVAMIEKMKGRKGVQESVYDLEGASGMASQAEENDALKPKFVLAMRAETFREDKDKVKKKREVQKPTFKYNKFAGIPYLNTPIKIDGNLSDWKDLKVPRLVLTRHDMAPYNGPPYKTSYLWVAYDSRGLYLGMEVLDHTGKIENDVHSFWLNDCIEVFIDVQNTKYRRRGEVHTHQFFVYPFGKKGEENIAGYEAYFRSLENRQWATKRHSFKEIQRKAKKTEKGWNMEMLITKEIMRRGELSPGKIIGFTVNICTGTAKTNYCKYKWSYDPKLLPSENPHTWGDIQLLGSDAELSLEGKDEKDTKPLIFPGEIIKVKVKDGDMNLDCEVKDKVRVKIAASSGDYEELVLEETGANTSVFTGAITTQLSLGGTSPNILDLYEGETMEVVYIDQAQSYGERNVRIVKEYPVTSSGAKFVSR